MPTIPPLPPSLKGRAIALRSLAATRMSELATGFIFANRVPEGNPSDPSYVLPLLDKVQSAIDRVSVPQRAPHPLSRGGPRGQ